jgi:hypothetical protein
MSEYLEVHPVELPNLSRHLPPCSTCFEVDHICGVRKGAKSAARRSPKHLVEVVILVAVMGVNQIGGYMKS